jgi:ornithine cyclodeaminase/alanine dehydrogenase-like protein (mu-crystallin family)
VESLPFFSNDDILKHISMNDAIQSMDRAFQYISSNNAVIPLRINMRMEPENADSLIMPVYAPDIQRYAVKTVSLNYSNRTKDLPLIHSVLNLFDASTGRPLAMMDAEIITALRTGAGGGLAAQRLSSLDSKHMVAFGAGIQSEYQIRAVLAIRNIESVTIISRTESKANELKQKLKTDFESITFSISNSISDISNADIISTATTSSTPIFDEIPLKSHVHINAVGSYKPTLIEIGPTVIKNCTLFVDQKSAALKEAGDILNAQKNEVEINESDVFELGEISNTNDQYQTKSTLFKSVGNAIQDLVLASTVYDKLSGSDNK